MSVFSIAICLTLTGLMAIAWNMRHRPTPPPTVDDLKFPVAVLFDQSDCRIHYDAADLGIMGLMRVMNYESSPYLIDNELNLFQMENLKSEKSSLQIMLSMGNGSTPVSFTLKAVRDDLHTQARELLTRSISSTVPDDESAEIRNRILSASTLNETLPPDWRR